MKFLIISGNPKKDGLCQSVVSRVARGGSDAGAEVEIITLENLGRCRVCGEGWGTCREEHRCAFGGDGFEQALEAIKEAACICLITPVYWGETSENLKGFLDRLRRCQFGAEGALAHKPVLMCASAGGSGNGILTALEQMDRFCRHTGAELFDYIGINRWNSPYKRGAAYSAAMTMVRQVKSKMQGQHTSA